MMAARDDTGGGTGIARRRRERRLRAYLRYARMSVVMALAECQHHSAQRQRTAIAWEEEREKHDTAVFRTTVPPPDPEIFDLFEELSGGRPPLLVEVRPQGPPERHTGVGFELVLDPVVPQMAEQLVKVDFPVQGGGGGLRGGLPGPGPGQGSTVRVQYSSSASTVFHSPASVVESFAPAPAVFQASSPAVEHIAPVPAVLQASPVVEYLHPRSQLFKHLRLWWSTLHPRLQLSKRPRQRWRILYPRQR